MKKMFATALLGLAVALGGVPGAVAPAAAQAAKGWHLAGKYHTYKEACRMADELEEAGYETCVKKQGSYYCVYYR